MRRGDIKEEEEGSVLTGDDKKWGRHKKKTTTTNKQGAFISPPIHQLVGWLVQFCRTLTWWCAWMEWKSVFVLIDFPINWSPLSSVPTTYIHLYCTYDMRTWALFIFMDPSSILIWVPPPKKIGIGIRRPSLFSWSVERNFLHRQRCCWTF